MHMLLSLEELKDAVAQYMRQHGYTEVHEDDVSIESHTEGEYDDKYTVFDGIAVNMDSKR